MAKKREKYVYYDLEFKTRLVILYLEGNNGYQGIGERIRVKTHNPAEKLGKKYKNRELTEKDSDGGTHIRF